MSFEKNLDRVYKVIKDSKLFNEEYYLKMYPKVNSDPIWHYIHFGTENLTNPSEYFDTRYYLEKYDDVKVSGINPLFHYILHGVRERRNPNPEFDTKFYYDENSELKGQDINPLLHYILYGKDEGYLINKNQIIQRENLRKKVESIRKIDLSKYDWDKYAEFNSDLVRNNVNLQEHYLNNGYYEGRRLILKENSLNNKKLTALKDYLNYKKTRGRSKTVVYTFNGSTESILIEPELINKDIDYIYFGIPSSSSGLSVWEFKDSGFYIDKISLLDTFHCMNFHILLPEYINIIWIKSFDYLNSKTYKNIDKFINSRGFKSYIFGNKYVLGKELSVSIKNDKVFSNLLFEDSFDIEGIDPNCIIFNDFNISYTSFFAEWWRIVIKYNLNNIIPMALINKVNSNYYPEASFKNSTESQSKVFLDTLTSYQESLIGNYNPKRDTALDNLSVTIVIPIFNALDDVKECVKSIETSTFTNYKVILADDGSSADVQTWLEDYAKDNERFETILADYNRGYTVNVNNAIEKVESDFIILLNSDTKVYGRWLEELIHPFLNDPTIGITGPLSNAAGWQTVPYLRGGDNTIPPHLNLKKVNDFLQNEAYSGSYALSDIVNGFCFCFSQKVLQTLGEFDEEKFPKGYGEEDDFCIRSRQAGFKNVVITNAYVHHSKSKSFGHEARIKLATAGRDVLDFKYGKEGYKLLTDSIGKNPVINATRGKLQTLFKPYIEKRTVIEEDVAIIPSKELLYPKDNRFDNRICVHLHMHYTDMVDYFTYYLRKIPFKFDLYITTNELANSQLIKSKFSDIKNLQLISVEIYENRGRDIYPFISTLSKVYESYDYCLHIHSKKSIHNNLGSKWLNTLMSNLLYSPEYITNILEIMERENKGLIFPPVLEDLYPNYKWGNNKPLAKQVLNRLGIDIDLNLEGPISFPAGNMYWGKTEALRKLFTSDLTIEDFPSEPIPIDGTLAHTLERILGFIVESEKSSSLIVQHDDTALYENEKRMFREKMLPLNSLYKMILDKIENQEPFALIRFYDGEGAFYKAEKWTDSFVNERFSYYFGEADYSKEDALFFRELTLSALINADVIGIPNLNIVQNMLDFTYNYADSDIELLPKIARRYNQSIDCNSAWRILSSFELVINALSMDKLGYCNKDVHYDLVLSGYIYKLLDRMSHINIITSQPVKPYLETLFELEVTEYSIPGRSIDTEEKLSTNHYPTRFDELQHELKSQNLRGQLFLVGAGPLGKAYCESIKNQGGIAIDIGAVFDSWINFRTRPEHATEQSVFNDSLLLTSKNIAELTDFEVIPTKKITINELPNTKVNKYLKGIFREL